MKTLLNILAFSTVINFTFASERYGRVRYFKKMPAYTAKGTFFKMKKVQIEIYKYLL